MGETCNLALPHWEVACQTEPAPRTSKEGMQLSYLDQSCPELKPKISDRKRAKSLVQFKDTFKLVLLSLDSMLLNLACATMLMLRSHYIWIDTTRIKCKA